MTGQEMKLINMEGSEDNHEEFSSTRAPSNMIWRSKEDELTELPPDTKVIITGNSRTKSAHIGLEGVVSKSIGFGGWHWLMLETGEQLKLQRNALTVLEIPEQSFSSNGATYQCNHNYDDEEEEEEDYIDSDYSPNTPEKTTLAVDLRKLSDASLWAYYKSYKLGNLSCIPSRETLVRKVERHFNSKIVDEHQVIPKFVKCAAKRRMQLPLDFRETRKSRSPPKHLPLDFSVNRKARSPRKRS